MRALVIVAILVLLSTLTAILVREGVKRMPPSTRQIRAARQTGTFTVYMQTSKGPVTMVLEGGAAPITVANFVKLAQRGFYDGLTFHRVEPGFVVQGGDPEGTGRGGPGYTIPDEKGPLRHKVGAVAMAKSSQPNSAGSQFYICLSAQPDLDGEYTVFGRITAGMEVVRKLVVGDRMVRVTVRPRREG